MRRFLNLREIKEVKHDYIGDVEGCICLKEWNKFILEEG